MGVKAGDFFVNLGIKGSDKTKNDVKGVKSGFDELKATSLEAKVALLAVLAVVEKITASSITLGQTLKNFSAITGISSKVTQEYSLAGKPYGVSEETTRSTLANIQTSMIGMKAGQDAPPWFLAMIRSLQEHGVKVDVSAGAIDRYAAHPEEIMQLQEKFNNMNQIPVAERTYISREMGVPDEVLAAYHGKAYEQTNLSRYSSMILSEKTLDSLEKQNQLNELNKSFFSSMAGKITGAFFEKDETRKIQKMAPDGSVNGQYYGYEAVIHHFKKAFAPQHFASEDKHLAPVVHKTVNISKTSNNSFTGVSAKDVPAIKKATQTDHADDIALTNSAHQDR